MSQTFQRVAQLVAQDEVRISAHGYEELEEDGLLASEVLSSVSEGVVVEDYPDYHKGPAVLVLQRDHKGHQSMCCGASPEVPPRQRCW
jgi:hypothetical protein